MAEGRQAKQMKHVSYADPIIVYRRRRCGNAMELRQREGAWEYGR